MVVSWTNPYNNLIQLAVQRSTDSVRKFTSVFSATSPELPVNGFADKVTPGTKVYYRIFYVMRGGSYYFTKSKQASTGPAVGIKEADSRRDQLSDSLIAAITDPKTNPELLGPDIPYYIILEDTLLTTLTNGDLVRFRDSIMTRTKDTLYQKTIDTILLARYIPPFAQSTSQYVYTDRDGFIVVKLPDALKKRYDLVFLQEDETPVLEFKPVKFTYFVIDKTNFYQAGWYKFELKENGRIKERNKIFLAKEF